MVFQEVSYAHDICLSPVKLLKTTSFLSTQFCGELHVIVVPDIDPIIYLTAFVIFFDRIVDPTGNAYGIVFWWGG